MSYKNLKKIISVAAGSIPADFIFNNAEILNVFTKKFEKKDLVIADSYIAAISNSGQYKGLQTVDCTNKKIVPGFIDAHVHIESSMLLPEEFGKIILEHGTSTVIADPHEITNVLGPKALDIMIQLSKSSPVSMFFMIPSCVPSTDFELSGGKLDEKDILKYIHTPEILGLGEIMNFPGVFNVDEMLLKKITNSCGKICDGHAPLVSGKQLNAYRAAGITSDHESATFNEVAEKVQKGLFILLREGSSAKDLEKILPELHQSQLPLNRFGFCTDDKNCADILDSGHIDNCIRKSINAGISIEESYCMASYYPACHYGLSEAGKLCSGVSADFVILDDAFSCKIHSVYKNGKCFSLKKRSSEITIDKTQSKTKNCENILQLSSKKAFNSIHIRPVTEDYFTFGINDKNIDLEERTIIQISEGTLNTISFRSHTASELLKKGETCKLAVIERHHESGIHSLALLSGYGLCKGAIASSIGHDSHNIICAGKDSADMKAAVEKIQEMQGGICIILNGKIMAELQLQFGGLMSTNSAKHVKNKLKELAKEALGLGISKQIEPFVTLSFLALPVIPQIRLTPQGLFDVTSWKFLKN